MPKAEFICYWCLLFLRDLHFVADSKGNNVIIDVKKLCHVQKIAPSLRKKGNILLVSNTLVLFQMAFKTRQTNFQNFPEEHSPGSP